MRDGAGYRPGDHRAADRQHRAPRPRRRRPDRSTRRRRDGCSSAGRTSPRATGAGPALTAERFVPDPFADRAGRRACTTPATASAGASRGSSSTSVAPTGRSSCGGIGSSSTGSSHVLARACRRTGGRRRGGRHQRRARPARWFSSAMPRRPRLQQHARATSPVPLAPDRSSPRTELPRRPNGKVDPDGCWPPPATGRAAAEHVAPATAPSAPSPRCGVTSSIAGGVSMTDDFFDVGGHSLLATRLASLVRHRFEIAPCPCRPCSNTRRRGSSPPSSRRPSPTSPPTLGTRTAEPPTAGGGPHRRTSRSVRPPGGETRSCPTPSNGCGSSTSWSPGARSTPRARAAAPAGPDRPRRRSGAASTSRAPVTRCCARPSTRTAAVRCSAIAPSAEGAARRRRRQRAGAGRPAGRGRAPVDGVGRASRSTCTDRAAPAGRAGARSDRPTGSLLLAIHHIVCDGWSTTVFSDELGAIYAAFAAGRPRPLPPLPIQYADFADLAARSGSPATGSTTSSPTGASSSPTCRPWRCPPTGPGRRVFTLRRATSCASTCPPVVAARVPTAVRSRRARRCS